MKTIIMFLLFTTMALSQNFTIRSLTARTTSNLTGTDIFLLSNSAGALNKVSYTNLMANFDDEAWTWTGAHTFSTGVTAITGGTFKITNIKTLLINSQLLL